MNKSEFRCFLKLEEASRDMVGSWAVLGVTKEPNTNRKKAASCLFACCNDGMQTLF